MLDDLWNWYSSDDPNHRILWLYGPAGAGKSAIAQSFSQRLEAEGRLGASFFFKRGHPSRGNGNKLFATIAYQLAVRIPEISQMVERDPTILDRSLLLQLQRLIVEPCQQFIRDHPLIIVIDGLDECEGKNIQQEILFSIGKVIQQPVPLRFFVASRPEPHIHETFKFGLASFHCSKNIDKSFEDVRKYLEDEFARLYRDHHHTMALVPLPWPSPAVLDQLVEKSSGYFIYASTVIKFIDDKDYRPTERLDIIMGAASTQDDESPFWALDQLYIQILSQIRSAARPRLLRILAVIVDIGLFGATHTHIEQLLELNPGDVHLALRGLHSVLIVPPPDEDVLQIHLHHASLGDFLSDPTRSCDFYVGSEHIRTHITHQILKAFTYCTHGSPPLEYDHVAW
ncbi:hypothetical protein DFH07DRAFT_735652 [Mycena maculata]|uniref:Nephrocystin 3-like N-terminal domain-containing protein n=1 Tax=Mycena maculata TaxID=230809 RepID=A0AAD7NQL3_9AGAR|nr:hypothetical protein DFH07DRAFT_735652 [Mycena maculata]